MSGAQIGFPHDIFGVHPVADDDRQDVFDQCRPVRQVKLQLFVGCRNALTLRSATYSHYNRSAVDRQASVRTRKDLRALPPQVLEHRVNSEGQAGMTRDEQVIESGYGPFANFETGGTKLIGRGGLFWVASLEAVEINYMVDPGAWGRGYATEVAAIFLDIGFRRHNLERMVATTNPANESSARVLAKVGMTRPGRRTWETGGSSTFT